MPIFEYKCSACGFKFEDLRTQSEADAERACPECGAPKVERLLSAFACGGGSPGAGSSGCGSSGSGRLRGG